jgi:IS30 family transposase
VQSRGALRKELTWYLRTGRVIRRPKGVRLPDGRSGRPNTLHISERPSEAEDRAVPGHWEADLVFGKAMSPVATLVERSTRFLMLVGLPGGNHQADAVADALAAAITTLPGQLAKSLTWDLGHQMAQHQRFTIATGVQAYFCDPKSPWQRGSNENTVTAASVPAQAPGPPHAHPGRLRRHRPGAQRTTSTDPAIQDTITSTS